MNEMFIKGKVFGAIIVSAIKIYHEDDDDDDNTYAPETILHTYINLFNDMKDIKISRTNWHVK